MTGLPALLMAGILPLARELIKLGTSVVLAANSVPSINDITVQVDSYASWPEHCPSCAVQTVSCALK